MSEATSCASQRSIRKPVAPKHQGKAETLILKASLRRARWALACRIIVTVVSLTCVNSIASGQPPSAVKPNILWLSCEDISAHLGCYGDPRATTPHLDQLASEGTLYRQAFATAGVCAPCRSAIITGMYQTTLGTHHMRCQAKLPPDVRPFPKYLREAGYYCTNNSKEDYQFRTPRGTWDESSRKAHWKNRPNPDQPFFAVFNYTGCHESGIASDTKYQQVTQGLDRHDRQLVIDTMPPYYPRTPEAIDDWGRYYDVVSAMDRWVGERLRELEEAGLREDTIVVFWSDHGVGLPRAKRWLYDSGIHVPLIIRIPKGINVRGMSPAGEESHRLISLLDLGPSMLSLAGVEVPSSLQGQPFLGEQAAAPRSYIFAARDRMDERYDIIRAVRDQQYKYIRNYEPFKAYYQYMNTPEKGRTMQAIRQVEANGNASPEVARFLTAEKPIEELYDTKADPHEMNNLANRPEYQEVLRRLRQEHLKWVERTRDLGLIPEAELTRLRSSLGSEAAILSGDESRERIQAIRDAASLSLQGPERIPAMLQALQSPDTVVRYWAAVGLGNQGPAAQPSKQQILPLLSDPSENTRVAAARALARMGDPQLALPTLTAVLDQGTQWARVHAANVLDEMDEQALPVLSAMKRNLAYRKELVAEGKYTVRVLNRALNELLGTSNVVK